MAHSGPSKLPRSFYNRDTLTVSRELIGKYIVYESPAGRLAARIVEVEAYIGEEDPACHAACGRTVRNQLMYGKAGIAYIYFIYGMYHCLNFVTERKGFPAAVLLRAAELVEGEDVARHHMKGHTVQVTLNGPGKFCRGFGLTLRQNGVDLTDSTLYLEDRFERKPEIAVSERIGIRKGTDRLWRFYDGRSHSVSRPAGTIRSMRKSSKRA